MCGQKQATSAEYENEEPYEVSFIKDLLASIFRVCI
jgi:hypothetical protein